MKNRQSILATLLASVLGSASTPAQVFEAPMKPGPFHIVGLFIAFIVDTRGLTLAERRMSRATSSGLDVTRAELLRALDTAARTGPPKGAWMLVYERP